MKEFRQKIKRIAGKSYGCYRDLRGGFRVGKTRFDLYHVQPDPTAPPSQVEISIPFSESGLPLDLVRDDLDRLALCDFVHRRVFPVVCEQSRQAGPARTGGSIGMARPSQEILARTAVQVRGETLRIRLSVALPADQRFVAGEAAEDLLLRRLPEAATVAAWWDDGDRERFELHRKTLRRARALRERLKERGLVAFVADGSLLPRKSGDSDEPAGDGIPFESPEAWRVALEAEGEEVVGMGVPAGISLIVGGAFHGKSTLLHALERGVYDHVPGDGREGVVTLPDARKIRCEEGRWISDLDLSLFAHDLPGGADARRFSTASASGAVSQAAAVVEALETGCSTLLVDEDASAVNFLFRDERMRALVDVSEESIVPLVDRAAELRRRGVSLVMVAGAGGDMLDLADRVLAMRGWRPFDATAEARAACEKFPSRRKDPPPPGDAPRRRAPALREWRERNLRAKAGTVHARAASAALVRLGSFELDLGALDQVVDRHQAQAIGAAILWLSEQPSPPEDLPAALALVERRLAEAGLDGLTDRAAGELAAFRREELACALCRLRGLSTGEA